MGDMIEALARGQDIAITPDGPRGPALKIKRGVIDLARRTNAPICPVGIAASHYRAASSWDAFQLPLPGARMAFIFGELIQVPDRMSPAERAAFRERVEQRLMDTTAAAERLARGESAAATDCAPAAPLAP